MTGIAGGNNVAQYSNTQAIKVLQRHGARE
jgi:hypothetical protein